MHFFYFFFQKIIDKFQKSARHWSNMRRNFKKSSIFEFFLIKIANFTLSLHFPKLQRRRACHNRRKTGLKSVDRDQTHIWKNFD